MEKKKKRLIILSVIAGVLLSIILLSSAIFTIKSASVEYQTTLTVLTSEELSQMVENADLPYGKSIFFSSLKGYMASMEKENPYVKINKIKRTFPNSLVVLVSERVPVVRFNSHGDDYILDNELKVLNVATNFSGYNSANGEKDLPQLIIAESFEFNVNGLTKGDFVNNETIQSYVDAFYRGAVTSSREDQEVAVSLINSIETITISYSKELEKVVFDLTFTGSSLTSKIIGDNNLIDCVYKIVKTVNLSLANGEDYEYINSTDGVVYTKKK